MDGNGSCPATVGLYLGDRLVITFDLRYADVVRQIANAHNAELSAEREIKSAEKQILLDEITKNTVLQNKLSVSVKALEEISRLATPALAAHLKVIADATIARIGGKQ